MPVREWLDKMTDSWAAPTSRDLAGPFRFLFWLTRSQWRRVVLGSSLGICWTVGLAVPPWVLGRAIDAGLVPGDTAALVRWALILLAVSVLNAALAVGRHRTMTKIRMDASFRSTRATVWHTARLGASLAHHLNAGEVVTVGISDVSTVANALTVTGPGIGAVVAYAVVAVVLSRMSVLLAVVVLAGVPLLAIMVGPLLQRIERTGGAYRSHQGRLTTRLVDALAGLRVLNGLGGKQVIAGRYEQQSQRLVERGYRVAGPASWVGALSSGLPALFLAVVVWMSARMAATGAISIGDVVAVYGYVAVLVVPVTYFIEGGGDIARARVAGQRIINLLNLPTAADESRASVAIPAGCGPLADPESGVIIRPGILTALVTARPAEANAVIDRLGQVNLDGSSGVTWSGVLIAATPAEEFRHRVVVADNDADIFAGTVRDIVAGRLEPDDGQIRAALHVAVADDIVEALPGRLDARIAARGSDLSGGQRQRIRLARAIYAEPDVLLAAEPTSAVDANTEAAMIERLRHARTGRTTVVTTTSPLVLARADEVIVLTDGKITTVGRHTHLLRGDATYGALVSRSQGGFEDEELPDE